MDLRALATYIYTCHLRTLCAAHSPHITIRIAPTHGLTFWCYPTLRAPVVTVHLRCTVPHIHTPPFRATGPHTHYACPARADIYIANAGCYLHPTTYTHPMPIATHTHTHTYTHRTHIWTRSHYYTLRTHVTVWDWFCHHTHTYLPFTHTVHTYLYTTHTHTHLLVHTHTLGSHTHHTLVPHYPTGLHCLPCL